MIDGERQQKDATRLRVYVLVRGIVQGVGFRPFVHRLAHQHRLAGWVLNSTEGVEIEVEGAVACVEAFLDDLAWKAPPAASIHRIDVHRLPPAGYSSFVIETSHGSTSSFPLVSPDIATCPDCLSELFDVADRRYRYPFINCTNCGPRFTIVEGVPYDRPKTTMKAFVMCPTCQREYDDPGNRRFHAQPNACPECGPSVWLVGSERVRRDPSRGSTSPGNAAASVASVRSRPARYLVSEKEGGDPIAEVRRLLKSGAIVAVKGLGGFHLACDATNAEAVRRLRERKRRVEKPFAIMVRDLEAVGRLCCVDGAETRLLSSARRPVVLLERRQDGPVANEVAPGNRRLGVMLPYTPIHHLLFEPASDVRFDALVMTSGNLGEEPIAKDNDEALSRLASLADAFLLHNRPIHARCDDSVTQVFEGKEYIIRRSRGYAPLPVQLDFEVEPVIACGAQLKSTFCITQGDYAFLSQHIGDLENQETLDFFAEAVDHFVRVFNLSPRIVAHDLHPDYLSTRYAQALFSKPTGLLATPSSIVGVQHHHAHVASCMAENGLRERVIGVAFDGTGYGLDGAIWGGEFLVADFLDFQRVAHLKYVPLPGGDAAIRKPYRIALSYLVVYGDNPPEMEFLRNLDPYEVEVVKRQIARNVNTPATSSCGRLFDAVAALLGVRNEVSYEGQAAIELEMSARDDAVEAYTFDISGPMPLEVDASPVIRSIVADLRRGEERQIVAAKFHNGVAQMVVEVCLSIREAFRLDKVCLSGGVFQNRFLLSRTLDRLRQQGFEAYVHHLVPCNDGGLSLGQAIVASERARVHGA